MTGWNTDGSRSEVYFSLHPRSFTEVDSFFRQRFHLSPSSASIASRQSPQSRAVSGFAQAFTPHVPQVYFVLLAAFFLRVLALPSFHNSTYGMTKPSLGRAWCPHRDGWIYTNC